MDREQRLTREAVALTHRTVETLRPASQAYRVPDLKSKGLALRVAPSGIKTWDLAFRIRGTGKVRRVSLGRASDVSLENARARAMQITMAARSGRDLPSEEEAERAAKASRLSVSQLIEIYVRRRVTGKLKTAKEIDSRLKRALTRHMAAAVSDLRRKDIRKLLDEVSDSGIEREAEKRRQTMGAMFRWALSQDLIDIDPTAGLASYGSGQLKHRVLSENELGTLWNWLEQEYLPPRPAMILKLQILLGARCGEIAGLRSSEIDPVTWNWTLPASRSKNGTARVTPLVGLARQYVKNCMAQTSCDIIFPTSTGRPLASSNVGAFLLNYADRIPIAKFTTHDLRRTFATMMIEMGHSLDAVAAVIGHVGGSRETRTLVRHYIRTDLLAMKAKALGAWDGHIASLVTVPLS